MSSSPSRDPSPLPFPSLASAHPFANSKGLLEIIPNGIDVEEESRLYDDVMQDVGMWPSQRHRSPSPELAPSIYSKDISLGENYGQSSTFARDVKIAGWTNVGDKPDGYICYDCTIKTTEDTIIHAHKRYSDFVKLESALRRALPSKQRHMIPELPPKAPLARYRPAFLDRRRRHLQTWLTAVLLHPELGGTQVVKRWVME